MKFSNMRYGTYDEKELQKLAKINASGLTMQVYLFIKLNIEVDNGSIKRKIGEDIMNYTSIAKRLGASKSGVKRAVDTLNEHGLLETHVLEQIVGNVVFVKHFKNGQE